MNINFLIRKRLGLCDSAEGSKKHVVLWPDGSYRWIYSYRYLFPGFMVFTTLTGLAGLFKKIAYLLLPIVGRFFGLKTTVNDFQVIPGALLSNVMEEVGADGWDLFGGSPGVCRNLVIAMRSGDKLVGYLKLELVCDDAGSDKKTELMGYSDIANLPLTSIGVPAYRPINGGLFVEPAVGHIYNEKYSEILFEGLGEMINVTSSETTIASYFQNKDLEGRLQVVMARVTADLYNDRYEMLDVCEKIQAKISAMLIEGGTKISVSKAFMDFTPWNVFFSKSGLTVIDLEFVEDSVSAYFDGIHFFCQPWMMADKSKSASQLASVLASDVSSILISAFGVSQKEAWRYIDLYTVYNSLRVLELYSQQEELHERGEAQLHIWSHIELLWLS